MSDLENEARSVLKDIILKGDAKLLDLRSIATIAAFAFKNVLVADCMLVSGDRSFFPFSLRKCFSRSLQIGDEIQMWIAGFDSAGRQAGFWWPEYKLIDGLFRGCRLYIFTYVVGSLALQVVSYQWLKDSTNPLKGKRLFFAQHPRWNASSIKFWPSGDDAILWPPSTHLTHQNIETFGDRWADLHLPPGASNLLVSS